MKSKLLLCFAFVGLAMATAKSYTVMVVQPAMVGSTELKAGEYRVEVVDQKAVIRSGKVQTEAPVKVETVDAKYGATSVRYSNDNGKMQIQEIRLGGTKTKLVFN